MQRTVLGACAASAALLALAGLARADVVDTREIDETVPITAGQPLVVIVKNIRGSVRVTGHDLDHVELHATEAVRGAALDPATVTDGDVTAEGVSGDFTVANVNGDVRLTGLVGSGSVHTVNGDVEATFERAPGVGSGFRTVNGELDVTFPENLSADFELATMQGDVFTDFEVASLTQAPTVTRDDDRGGFTMRSNRNSAFRVGAGGETHSFHTLNGDIYVRKANR